jgi:scyllo-inositol 2-dehydrogenase (NADP+)
MKVIVIGLGVQGYKRQRIAGSDCVATVDPENQEADFRDITDVPVSEYDAALVCTPDAAKKDILRYLINQRKHILVEKPLVVGGVDDLIKLQEHAIEKSVVVYTAYNHRFEPHFEKMGELIKTGALGNIYRCRMFYGNGTARLVRNSKWRDQGAGVLPDLGSHLIDTVNYWFPQAKPVYELISAKCFENNSPDHVVIGAAEGAPQIELEMTMLMWRNHFTCDVLGENGSAHITSLCKWGPSTFIHRERVLPSGRPLERTVTLEQSDPTWNSEYRHFINLCKGGEVTDLSGDMLIQRALDPLCDAAIGNH